MGSFGIYLLTMADKKGSHSQAELREMSLLTVAMALDYLHISRQTLYKLINAGEIVPVKIGKRTLFKKEDIDRFIDGHQKK